MRRDNEILVEVKGVSKKFSSSLKQSMWYGLKDVANAVIGRDAHSNALRDGEFWAVKDINFSLRRGECLGLIGHNGAGKSTLLKMLNGLIRPDEGSITMRGKVGALIELGAGFNPLLSGRENVYINGQLLGFSRKEIEAKFQDILDFAEIGEFIDSPVQNYSSGMKVRLGFAVAAQMEPDILLIDEVLAVGDMGFVLKCFNKMDELKSKTAMIFVSHGMPQVARMCTHLCILSKGKTVFQSDDVPEGITKYYELFKNEIGSFNGSGKARIGKLILSSGNLNSNKEGFRVEQGAELTISIEILTEEEIHHPIISLMFYDKEQRNFAEVLNFEKQPFTKLIENKATFIAYIRDLPFAQGNYSVTIAMTEIKNNVRSVVFRSQSAIYFHVHGSYHGWAPIHLNASWERAEN